MAAYHRPRSLGEALTALAAPHVVLAGGTDFYPARVGRAIDEDVLDIGGIAALRGITEDAAGWRLGATTTWSELIEADLPPLFDGLKQAAREVGGRQIQNVGTIAGNLCNASPAADGVPCLLALDAAAEIAGPTARRLPLGDFVTGARQTALQPGELLAAIHVPRPARPARSGFLKLGARRYLVISIAMAAAVVEFERDRVAAARVAVGACSPVARRLPALEAALIGSGRKQLAARVDAAQLAPLSPIDDVRGSAAYRRDAVVVLLRRLLEGLAS
ncbi:MAG: xanthine dehydrogenase family protein subunit M [Alphaproteobacteria bacterium]|nr:xanthine dehydrogenase family protein subunit M [Alphaproteobacteria bacterium]